MIISTNSKRIHKENLNCKDDIDQLLRNCNDAKISCYSKLVNNEITEKELNTTYIIKAFGLNTYYASMVRQTAIQCLKSNIELQKLYIDDIKESIENQSEKIENLSDKLQFWKNVKKECINQIKTPNNKTIFPCMFYDNGTVKCFDKLYKVNEFEYLYVNNRINQIKSNIYHAKNKLNALNCKLKMITEQYPISCFGTKDFFKKQYTIEEYIENHDKWKNEFDYRRHNHFVISGSKNHTDGSMCVRYNPTTKLLSIMSHKQGTLGNGKKYYKQSSFNVPCEFADYHYAEYLETLKNRENISYEIKDKGDYYIISATFDYKYEDKKRVNDYIGDGVVSIDINVDRFALTNLDKNGNLLNRKVIYFNLEDKSSNQSTKILETKVHEVLDFCKEYNKPLVRENITKIQFKPTTNKHTNKILTQFAYDKMIETIDRIFEKNSIKVFKINPSYTSQQGKIKYMRRYGMSIHESAAMCIGRRFLFSIYDDNGKVIDLYYENLLDYKRFGTIKYVSNQFKKMKHHNFYQIEKTPFDIKKYKSLKTYIDDVNHYFYNNGEILKRSKNRLKTK